MRLLSLLLAVVTYAAPAAAAAQTPAPAPTKPDKPPAKVEKPRTGVRITPTPRTVTIPSIDLDLPDFELLSGRLADLADLELTLPSLEHLGPALAGIEIHLPELEHLTPLPDLDLLALDHVAPALADARHALEGLSLDIDLPEPLISLQGQSFRYDRPEPFFRTDSPDEARSAWLRARPDQGSPEDSLYRTAHRALSRGEYTRASTLFQSLEQKYPRSRVAPASLYYRAFALYRAGSTADLKTALETLQVQQQKYAQAAADPEAGALRTRIYAALAARGDRDAERALVAASAQGSTCDREEMEVRASALSALVQVNPEEARPTLQKVLGRRDECSVTLRRRAVYLLGRAGSDEAINDLLAVAKNDPDESVRADAIGILARSSARTTVPVLEQLFNTSTNDRTRLRIVQALRSNESPEARRALRAIIEREDLPEPIVREAISSLSRSASGAFTYTVKPGQNVTATRVADSARSLSPEAQEDATWLRNLYARSRSAAVKTSIISALARIGGPANDQWLIGLVRNRDEDLSLRREAINRLRPSNLSVADLGRLFDAVAERDLRHGILNQLARREEDAATDKLIEIARSGTDPEIRRSAIQALARKKDPRSTRLLMELVEKP